MKKLVLYLAFIILFTTSCASVNTTQIDKYDDLKCICIQKNPKVIVGDFLQCLIEVLGERNIRSKVFQPATTATIVDYDINGNPMPNNLIPKIQDECDYYITYVANLQWDMATYMNHADINLYNQNNEQIGHGEYDDGGGFDLSKFKSTKTKVRMILDEMLSNYPLTDNAIQNREKEQQEKLKKEEENQ